MDKDKIITENDEIIVNTLLAMRKAERQASALMESYKPMFNGERLMTDGELATVLKVSSRTLRDYRNSGLLPYIRMKGGIVYKESDIERVLQKHYHKSV